MGQFAEDGGEAGTRRPTECTLICTLSLTRRRNVLGFFTPHFSYGTTKAVSAEPAPPWSSTCAVTVRGRDWPCQKPVRKRCRAGWGVAGCRGVAGKDVRRTAHHCDPVRRRAGKERHPYDKTLTRPPQRVIHEPACNVGGSNLKEVAEKYSGKIEAAL